MSQTIWVCGACSKVGKTRESFGDETCYTWAVECWRSSVVYRSPTDRRAKSAVCADQDWVEPGPSYDFSNTKVSLRGARVLK